MNEFNFNSFGNSKQSISYCEVDKCEAVIKLKKCLQEIKEIAELACEKSVCDRNHCDYCLDGRIIKIINEVENDN